MSAERTTSQFRDIVSLNYPTDSSINISFFQNHSLTLPNTAVKLACGLGILTALYSTKYIARGIWWAATTSFCRVAQLFRKLPQKGTAVIYGATNKIGKAYASKLAEDGFTLILIDYSKDRLLKLEQQLRKTVMEDEKIICCVLGRATSLDQMQSDGGLKTVYNVIKAQAEITYFINCRNLKTGEVQMLHMMKADHIIIMTYYNMTVLAAILRKVLKVMSSSHKGKVISINTTYEHEEILKRTHPLFYATSMFSSTLMETLMISYKELGVQFLVVNNNYRSVASNKKYKTLVEQSLNKVGFESEIFI